MDPVYNETLKVMPPLRRDPCPVDSPCLPQTVTTPSETSRLIFTQQIKLGLSNIGFSLVPQRSAQTWRQSAAEEIRWLKGRRFNGLARERVGNLGVDSERSSVTILLPQYSIQRPQLLHRSILIAVWHYGRLSRNTFLGEVEIPLDSRDLDSSHLERTALMPKVDLLHSCISFPGNFLRALAKRGLVLLCPQQAAAVPSSVFTHYKGELVISLKFIPPKKPAAPLSKGKTPAGVASLKYRSIYCVNTSGKKAEPEDGGELHVLVKEAKNLVGVKPRATLDTFVKGFVIMKVTGFPLTL